MQGLEPFGVFDGHLEIRAETKDGIEIVAEFPTGPKNTAIISDRGRTRKEYFADKAFDFALADEKRELAILRGHDPNMVLGLRSTGNARFESSVDGFRSFLSLPRQIEMTFNQSDFLAELRQGLVTGISPGFRIPPSSAVRNAVELIPEAGNPDVMIRRVNAAVLYEVSFVARPAYKLTSIVTRDEAEQNGLDLGIYRWL